MDVAAIDAPEQAERRQVDDVRLRYRWLAESTRSIIVFSRARDDLILEAAAAATAAYGYIANIDIGASLAEMVVQLHERLAGSGQPAGLAGWPAAQFCRRHASSPLSTWLKR